MDPIQELPDFCVVIRLQPTSRGLPTNIPRESNPTKIHSTYKNAYVEATRLADLYPNDVFVVCNAFRGVQHIPRKTRAPLPPNRIRVDTRYL